MCHRELIVTPGNTMASQTLMNLQGLLSNSKMEIQQVTLNMKRCQNISSESIQRLQELYDTCATYNVEMAITNCSASVLKSLAIASIDFLELAQF